MPFFARSMPSSAASAAVRAALLAASAAFRAALSVLPMAAPIDFAACVNGFFLAMLSSTQTSRHPNRVQGGRQRIAGGSCFEQPKNPSVALPCGLSLIQTLNVHCPDLHAACSVALEGQAPAIREPRRPLVKVLWFVVVRNSSRASCGNIRDPDLGVVFSFVHL